MSTLVTKIQLVNRQWYTVADEHVDYTCNNNYPIRWASFFGHLELVNKLLQNPKVNPAVWKNEPIRVASARDHIDIVNRLLEDPRVNPGDQNNEAIKRAASRGYLAVVDRLL
jgi:ankyrin repeat protein